MSDSNTSNKTGLKGILSFFGIKDQAPVTTDQIDYKNMVPTRYTPEDMGQIHKMMLSHTDGGQKTQDISFHAALNEFNIIQQRTALRKANNSNIKQVAPEVSQAANLMASAIFNPNDMQDGSYTFHCDTDLISEEARVLIVQALSDYFNDKQKLAIHHHEMVKDILYMSGAKPVLILPTTALMDMIDKSVVGIESIDPKKKHLKRETLWDMAADPNKSLFGMNTAHKNIGLESLNIYDDDLGNEFTETLVESIALEMFEEERARNPNSTRSIDDIKNSVKGLPLKAGLEQMSKKLIEDLESGKSVRTTDRLELLGLLGIKTEHAQKEQTKKVRSYFSTPNRVIQQPFVELSPDQSVEETFHPIVVDLPVESVIPVFVPGSPDKHIGYFVIQDELGNPINNYSFIHDQANQSSLSKESVQAFFGRMDDKNSGSFGAVQKNAAKHLYKNETIHKVFNSVFDKYIQTHMQKTGVPTVDTSVTEAISKCMMIRFFRRAKTTLVYVPKEHLIYYAFDYHDDGTGKSLVDDIQYVLSIRVMLTVASMLSAVRNAVDKTVLSIDYGKHISNPRAISETLRQVFTDGKKTTFTYDPVMATQDIQREAVKIIPANIEGLTTYKVETDNRSSSKIEADTDFMSKLDEMMIYALGVPHADMNHLSKDEYSRSVATRNILFAKEIIRKAATLCSLVDEHIRVYTRYSGPLRKAIAAACEDRLTSSGTEGGEDVIDRIIDSIWVSLPKPNIAVDKAQYTEIREAIEIIETLIDKIYPDECAPGDYSNEMRMVRATVKAHKLREIISTIGASSNVTSLPKLDEILDLSDINKIHMTMKNLKAMVERLEKAFEPKEEQTDSSYSSDSDDSSDSGGDPESVWGGDSGDNEETPEGDATNEGTPEEETSEEPEETDPEQSWGDNEEHVDDEPDKSEWTDDDETSDKPTKGKKKESEEDPSTSWE